VQGESAVAGAGGAMLWQGLTDRPTALAWHPTSPAVLAFGCEDGAVGLFDTVANCGAVFKARHAAPVTRVAWAPGGPEPSCDGTRPECGAGGGAPPMLLTLGGEGRLLSWGALDAEGLLAASAAARGSGAAAVAALASAPADLLASGALAAPGAPRGAAAVQVTALSLHPTRSLMAAGLEDGSIAVWTFGRGSAAAAAELGQAALDFVHARTQRLHAGAVRCVQWCPDVPAQALTDPAWASVRGPGPALTSTGPEGGIEFLHLAHDGARLHPCDVLPHAARLRLQGFGASTPGSIGDSCRRRAGPDRPPRVRRIRGDAQFAWVQQSRVLGPGMERAAALAPGGAADSERHVSPGAPSCPCGVAAPAIAGRCATPCAGQGLMAWSLCRCLRSWARR